MPSLMELLLESMPMAAAKQALEMYLGKSFDQIEAHEAKKLLRFVPDAEEINIPLPEVSTRRGVSTQPLWGWKHNPSQPASVRDLYGRVRDADYVGHLVTTRLSWGLEDTIGSFEQAIRITFATGSTVLLPLTSEYVLWRVLINGGTIADDQTPLWKLRSIVDTSLAVAFVFDIDPNNGTVHPVDFDAIKDPKAREDWDTVQRAVKQLMSSADNRGTEGAGGEEGLHRAEGAQSGGPGEDLPPVDYPAPLEEETMAEAELKAAGGDAEASVGEEVDPTASWGERICRGDIFWRPGWEPKSGVAGTSTSAVSGEVGEVMTVTAGPAVIVVLVTFTNCCERADYEPAGMVGFARCYPHVMVRGNVAIAKVEASIQMDRPTKLTTWPEANRNMQKTCCLPEYDGWTEELRGLFVADANKKWPPAGPPLPFWSNMFSHVLEDPFLVSASTKFHMVRANMDQPRSAEGLIVRKLVLGLSTDETPKAPFQGAFDNLHVAPRLKLKRVAKVMGPMSPKALLAEGEGQETIMAIPVTTIDDSSALHLDRIAMAPFCAHDCLHMHWRWPIHAKPKWVLGWNENSPYSEAGAPHVPRGQDIWMWFRSESTFTYHVVAEMRAERQYDWCVLMHHGFGHAVSISDRPAADVAMFSTSSFAGDYVFLDDDNNLVYPMNSTAAYYWHARYELGVKAGKPVAMPRLVISEPDGLRKAIDL